MSSYMNYSELQPLTMIPSLSTMIQDNTNPNVNKLIEIKETVLDIINTSIFAKIIPANEIMKK